MSPIRQQLRKHILDEQNNFCAYTELRLYAADDCHIDHYHTRNLFPDETFKYDNLLVSCLVQRRKTVVANLILMKDYLMEDEMVSSLGEFETMIRQLYNDL
nr:retron system putative HNH endonuclease [uncultured Bacteroides sp.]